MQRIKCRVEELREYVDTIWHVALTPQQEISFKPGQYLLVVMSLKWTVLKYLRSA